jgi:hypothetical protein
MVRECEYVKLLSGIAEVQYDISRAGSANKELAQFVLSTHFTRGFLKLTATPLHHQHNLRRWRCRGRGGLKCLEEIAKGEPMGDNR